jgi:alkylation response protein AidB-like acyl-CoA dehydrogenase
VKKCVQALGAAHLLGVGWPKEYGGGGFTAHVLVTSGTGVPTSALILAPAD